MMMIQTYLEHTYELVCVQKADRLQKPGESLDPYRGHHTGGVNVDENRNHEVEEPSNNARLRAQEFCPIDHRFFGCNWRNNALIAILN